MISRGLIAALLLTVGSISAKPAYQPTVENEKRPEGRAPAGMVWIPGGEFSMGTEDPLLDICDANVPMRDAQPVHRAYVEGFWMDAKEVTNAQFATFVAATKYVTVAERPLRPEDYPGVPRELLVPGSLVFSPPPHAVSLADPSAWWRYVPGASWRHPEGPGSDLVGRDKHPVVQVAYEDASAYANWSGGRLPTEAEWEFAARGGRAGQRYPWGDAFKSEGRAEANLFQGKFPFQNAVGDGYAGAAPTGSFEPNAYGLFDMAGNVWEWCGDWYRVDTYQIQVTAAKGAAVRNPRGPSRSESDDPQEPGVAKRVQRGGSFLCTEQYCTRYLVGSRGKGAPDTASDHVGFRCVRDP